MEDKLLQVPPGPPTLEELSAMLNGCGKVAIDDRAAINIIVDYRNYLKRLEHHLCLNVKHIFENVKDIKVLQKVAGGLLRLELERREQMKFLFIQSPDAFLPMMKIDLIRPLTDNLRECVLVELELLRDSRLRIEFYRAELINRERKGLRGRIILQGGSQIRIYFSNNPARGT